jgi:hypothetical protein
MEAGTGLPEYTPHGTTGPPLLRPCADALGQDAAGLLAEGAFWSVAEITQAAGEALRSLAN